MSNDQKSADGLLPCAFCRGPSTIRGNALAFYGACSSHECGATTRSCKTVAEAQTVWNTRTDTGGGVKRPTDTGFTGQEIVNEVLMCISRHTGWASDGTLKQMLEWINRCGEAMAKTIPTPAAVGVTDRMEAIARAESCLGFLRCIVQCGEPWSETCEKAYREAKVDCATITAALSARSPSWDTDAARDVVAERQRQISAEGWTPGHDDEHGDGSMADAAACYALTAPVLEKRYWIEGDNMSGGEMVPSQWPRSWRHEWWKPKDRRRDLVRAGALILAEIERLDREKLRLGGLRG